MAAITTRVLREQQDDDGGSLPDSDVLAVGRKMNLDAMAMTPSQGAGSHAASARSNKLKDNPVISGERRSGC